MENNLYTGVVWVYENAERNSKPISNFFFEPAISSSEASHKVRKEALEKWPLDKGWSLDICLSEVPKYLAKKSNDLYSIAISIKEKGYFGEKLSTFDVIFENASSIEEAEKIGKEKAKEIFPSEYDNETWNSEISVSKVPEDLLEQIKAKYH